MAVQSINNEREIERKIRVIYIYIYAMYNVIQINLISQKSRLAKLNLWNYVENPRIYLHFLSFRNTHDSGSWNRTSLKTRQFMLCKQCNSCWWPDKTMRLGISSHGADLVLPEYSWWRHQMETFSALLAICAGNSPVPGEVPAQRPVTQSFDVFFDVRLNKRLSKQSQY